MSFSPSSEISISALRGEARRLLKLGKTEEAMESVLSVVRNVCEERDLLAQRADALGEETRNLSEQVKHLVRLLYGRRSEKLSPEELGQLVLALGGTEHEASEQDPNVPTASCPEESAESADGKSPPTEKKRRKHPGRTQLSAELERVIHEHRVPEEERRCACCGSEMECFGHLEHERVEFIPARLIVHVDRREKLGCKACQGDAVTAEREQAPCVTRRVGASLLATLIEDKCDDALPIYRQQDRLARLGFDVPLPTLYSYWTYATDLLFPIAETTMSVVLGSEIVGIDDTKLCVLDKSKPDGRYNGHRVRPLERRLEMLA